MSPLSGLRATSQRPTLRWALPADLRRARVEVCEDRACTRRIVQADVVGDAWRPAAPLRPGVVFWRVSGRTADGEVAWTSATWVLGVRRRDTPVDSAWGNLRDFDGDGFDDLVALGTNSVLGGHGPALILRGTSEGAHPQPQPMILSPVPGSSEQGETTATGDVNADGLADLAIGHPWFQESGEDADWWGGNGQVRVFTGNRGCPLREAAPLRTPVAATREAFGRLLSIGDFNGDGFGDLVVAGNESVALFQGTSEGVRGVPGSRVRFRRASGGLVALRLVGDLDADGYGDVAVGNDERVYVLHGNAEGRLDARITVVDAPEDEPPRNFGDALTGADYDGDGLVDLTVGARGCIYIYRGGREGLSAAETVLPPSFLVDRVATVPEPGDLDGDGLPEIIASPGSMIALFRSRGSEPFPRDADFIYEGPEPGREGPRHAISPGDMDGDGYDDFAVGCVGGYFGRVHLYRGGRLPFSEPVISWGLSWSPSGATVE